MSTSNGHRGEGTRAILEQMLKTADVEFVLKCTREVIGKGLKDILTLAFSRDLLDFPARKELARAHLKMTGYKDFWAELYYLPRNAATHRHEFILHHDEQIYTTNLDHVLLVAYRLIKTIDGIANHPFSLVTCVSLTGLDYFDGTAARRKGDLAVIENQAEPVKSPPSLYNTLHEEAQGFKDWLEYMKRRFR